MLFSTPETIRTDWIYISTQTVPDSNALTSVLTNVSITIFITLFVLHNTCAFFHPINYAIKKSIVPITARFAPVNDWCALFRDCLGRRTQSVRDSLCSLPHPLPSNFSPPFEFVQHGARNRNRLIEFSAFSQIRQLRRLRRWHAPESCHLHVRETKNK